MNLDEPLLESALLAQQYAKHYCKKCAWYHGFWQYLRLLGIGKTLSGQSQFFSETVQKKSAIPNLNILISGCADYSMLALVVASLKSVNRQIDSSVKLTVLDICQTPLKLCQWYADQNNFQIDLIESDILSYSQNQQFDLIITSSFLGYFSDQSRNSFFLRCNTLLKLGGSLVFANRLSPQKNSELKKFSSRDSDQLLSTVLKNYKEFQLDLDLTDRDLTQLVHDYCREMKSYPVTSSKMLRMQLENAGLQLAVFTERYPELPRGNYQSNIQGPTMALCTPYICVEALLKHQLS